MKKRFLWIVLLLSTLSYTQTDTLNYIIKKTYKEATLNPIANPTIQQANTQIAYFDGLGRPIQTINYAQAPNDGDIITHIEYDAFGRQEKEYLPYVRDNASLDFEDDIEPQIEPFYQTIYPNETTPFSQKEFEASPLNRVLKQAAPGEAWQMGSGHEIKFDYQVNSTADAVRAYTVNTNWNPSKGSYDISLQNANTHYSENQLYKTITVDENNTGFNGARTEEFKNKQGQVVLKRIYAKSNGSSLERYDTYYVYDSFGNLTYVLPPKVNTTANAISSDALNGLCYQYKYDHRNRMVAKKIPGKAWEYIVYDKLDRVRATGPVLSPFTNLGQGWLFTKYDAFDRPIMTMFIEDGSITEIRRKQIQNEVDAHPISEHKASSPQTVNGTTFQYSNDSYPTDFYGLSINYFDDYEYPNSPSIPSSVYGQPVRNGEDNNCKGLPTGSWSRVLTIHTNNNANTSYTLYLADPRMSPVRVYSKNYKGGFTQIDTKYDDFEGKIEETRTTHSRNTTDPQTTVLETFEYTDQGLLDYQTHKVNNATTEEVIAKNYYNKLGTLGTKDVGNVLNTPHQQVNYTYNIRGWLKDITPSNTDPMFAFHICYNNPDTDFEAKPLYNGNISETYWLTGTDNNTRMYAYTYDDLNRLEMANYHNLSNTSINGTFNESLVYDKNGNIVSLHRKGGGEYPNYTQEIDILVYDYGSANTSNQLLKVDDSSNSTQGFKNVAGNDYTYDAFGNMISDNNKNITQITYNHLNLPKKISFGSTNNYIEYTYDATGVKVKKKVKEGNTLSITDYLDGYQYNNNVLQFFPHAEGYVDFTEINANDGEYRYVYQYKDHLGNIRINYAWDDEANELTVLNEHHYYPFGLEHTAYNTTKREFKRGESNNHPIQIIPVENAGYQYKYNGKEYNDELGYNMYDFDLRHYDPAIGRWVVIDPLSEQMRRHSPYNYAFDNPIYFIDPDGRAPEDIYVNENGDYLGTDGSDSKKVRVVSQEKWDEVNSTTGAQSEEGTNTLQKSENSTLLVGTDKYTQPGYQKGISISDETWGKIEDAGGTQSDATVVNNSDSSAFIKPEHKVENGPGAVGENENVEVKSGQSVFGMVDGVKTESYSDAVFKLVDGNKVSISNGGNVNITSSGGVAGFFGSILKGGWSTTEFPTLRTAPVGKSSFKSKSNSKSSINPGRLKPWENKF